VLAEMPAIMFLKDVRRTVVYFETHVPINYHLIYQSVITLLLSEPKSCI